MNTGSGWEDDGMQSERNPKRRLSVKGRRLYQSPFGMPTASYQEASTLKAAAAPYKRQQR